MPLKYLSQKLLKDKFFFSQSDLFHDEVYHAHKQGGTQYIVCRKSVLAL